LFKEKRIFIKYQRDQFPTKLGIRSTIQKLIAIKSNNQSAEANKKTKSYVFVVTKLYLEPSKKYHPNNYLRKQSNVLLIIQSKAHSKTKVETMNTPNQISVALLFLVFTLSGIAVAKKPADRILIISKEGKIIEIFRKPEKLVNETYVIDSLDTQTQKNTISENSSSFDITQFIKPEEEINDLELDTYSIFRKIKALEAQIK
jgi:hypothetical protein